MFMGLPEAGERIHEIEACLATLGTSERFATGGDLR